jgi:alpha-beta hydrolase superfamily lysophospholipase
MRGMKKVNSIPASNKRPPPADLRAAPTAGLPFDPERLHRQLSAFSAVGTPQHGDAVRDYFRFYGIDCENRFPGLQHHFGHFTSGKYEIVLHYFALPAPTGTCFIFHGYFDHVGLFRHVIEYCLQRNLNVVAYDLPGHGLSTGERASISAFTEYGTVLQDCLKLFANVAPQPWQAIAQSTGGAVIMDHLLLEEAPSFDRVVLLAPLVRAAEWLWVKTAYWLGHKFLQRVTRRFAVNSGDEAFLNFIEKSDPLQERYISVRWVDALLRWERRFEHLPSSERTLLIIQGQRDTTVDWRYNIPTIRKKFPRAKYLPLQDAFHHLANEKPAIRDKIFAAIDLYFGSKINERD